MNFKQNHRKIGCSQAVYSNIAIILGWSIMVSDLSSLKEIIHRIWRTDLVSRNVDGKPKHENYYKDDGSVQVVCQNRSS